MKRRDFFKRLGILSAVAMVAPKTLIEKKLVEKPISSEGYIDVEVNGVKYYLPMYKVDERTTK